MQRGENAILVTARDVETRFGTLNSHIRLYNFREINIFNGLDACLNTFVAKPMYLDLSVLWEGYSFPKFQL